MLALRADDRVLFLAIPPLTEMTAMSRVVMAGCLVALGERDEVDQARRELAEFDNVMFVNATPERIPWRDQFFTKVVVPPHLERLLPSISGELHRVLAPGGAIVTSTADA
jgi:hypothetical protein